LAREFLPKFEIEDLINLPNHGIYLKLMIDGTPSRPFSARSMDIAGIKNAKRAQVETINTRENREPDSNYL